MTNLFTEHIPVLFNEVLQALHIQSGGLYIDGTLGAGGHTFGLLSRGGHVIAFDWDAEAIAYARQQLSENGYTEETGQIRFIHDNFAMMAKHTEAMGITEVDGILLDLGLSSRQLDQGHRGFSFRFEAPLDMRFDHRQTRTAANLINDWSAEALADIFWRFGEEKRSRRIAAEIVKRRPMSTTTELVDAVTHAVGKQKSRIHPATRVFQAIRIALNGELASVESGIQAAISLLKPGGRLAVISFHSLEDRLIKQTFRRLSDPFYEQPEHTLFIDDSHITLKRVTRKPIVPTEEEIAHNPRSRSAKLRVAEKL